VIPAPTTATRTPRILPVGSEPPLAHEDEIDGELVTWLRDAYRAAAG
jgi:hypothetical protein